MAWSRALVGSSNSKTFELLYNVLAIPILCFWPTEIFEPNELSLELNLSGRELIKSKISASFDLIKLTLLIFSLKTPKAMLLSIDPSLI